jgi:glycosyltransferase 2 family protein
LRKYLILAVKFAILAIILIWIIRSFDEKHWQALLNQPKQWGLLFLSLLIVLAAHIISFLRWSIFVQALEVPISVTESLRLGFLGNLFNFVSLGAVGGDLFKAIAAAKQVPGKRAEVVASVLVDRALGLLGLVLVAAICLEVFGTDLSPTLDWIRRGAWMLSLIGIGSLALVVFVGHHLPTYLLHRIPFVGEIVFRMASAGMLFEGRPRLVLELLGISCVVHSFLTLGMYCISIGLYSETPSIKEHFLTVPPAFAAAALPLTPGGVGVQEMAIATLFEKLPQLPKEFSGLIVAVFYRLNLVIIAAIGGIYYILGAREIQSLQEEASHLDESL